METYNLVFESWFLEETNNFYSIKAAGWLENSNAPEFIQLVTERLLKEEQLG